MEASRKLVDTWRPRLIQALRGVALVQPTSAREDRRVLVRVTTSSQFQHVNDSESCSRLNNRNPTAWVPPVVVDAANNQPIDNAFIIRDLKDDGVVRASNTLYDREKYGYYFYIKPTVIGSWWEKWLAVKAMGDANTDFIGVDSSSDTRSFLINLNTIFGDSLNNLIGGAITGNVKGYGAALRPDGSMDPLPLLDLITGNSFDRTTVIDPTIDPDQQYTFRLLALYNAAYNGQYTDNYEFGESIKIGMSQALTDVQVDAAIRADPTRFTSVRDPVTGVYYYSVKQVRSGADDLYSIGFEFIREIKEKYYVGGADGDGETLLPGFQGTFEFQPRQDLEVAQIIAATASTFGYADVWSGDLDF